jgi:hypothetical protein
MTQTPVKSRPLFFTEVDNGAPGIGFASQARPELGEIWQLSTGRSNRLSGFPILDYDHHAPLPSGD